MVMSSAGMTALVRASSILLSRGRATSTNPQLFDTDKNLVLFPSWGLAIKTDWLTDRRL
jgi:hypothetical protein